MNDPAHHRPPPLEESPRFAPPTTRRDFLGQAGMWSAAVSFVLALAGALRLPMPAVFPESNPKARIGPPDAFPSGSKTYLPHLRLWVFHDERGMYAISAVCTHLGCIVARDRESGGFKCPCHGSVFKADGKVAAGPAPAPLRWLQLSVAADGQLVVNQQRNVPMGTRLTV